MRFPFAGWFEQESDATTALIDEGGKGVNVSQRPAFAQYTGFRLLLFPVVRRGLSTKKRAPLLPLRSDAVLFFTARINVGT
ncbi:MAG: hypothetical protein ACRECW_16660 [Phyllobacterium sp.]